MNKSSLFMGHDVFSPAVAGMEPEHQTLLVPDAQKFLCQNGLLPESTRKKPRKSRRNSFISEHKHSVHFDDQQHQSSPVTHSPSKATAMEAAMHGEKIEINDKDLSPSTASRLSKHSFVVGVWHSPFWSRQFLCKAVMAGCKVVTRQGEMCSTDVICYETTIQKAVDGVLTQLEELYPQ